MVKSYLARSIHALLLGSMAVGMTPAHADEIESSHATVHIQQTASADPETEIGNGLTPPRRIQHEADNDDDDDASLTEPPVETDRPPESEVTEGWAPLQ